MFSDGLSENGPCWALKLCLCFSTVIAAGPDGAFPSTRSMLYIGVGGRAGLGLSVFFHCFTNYCLWACVWQCFLFQLTWNIICIVSYPINIEILFCGLLGQ